VGKFSDEAYRILGIPRDGHPPTLTDLMNLVHPDDRASVSEATSEHGTHQDRGGLEYRIIRPNGDVRHVHARCDEKPDEVGRPHHAFGTIQDITDRKRTEAQLEDLAGRLINTQEEERRRIGRELHDHVSQRLAVLAIMTDRLRADSSLPAPVQAALDAIYSEADEISTEVHTLSHQLHSSVIDQVGLVPALEALLTEHSGLHGIHVEFSRCAVSHDLSSDAALCLLRIAQESLGNVIRHSRASTVRVDLRDAGDGVLLSIEDDGMGFQPQATETSAGLGFISMRERLRLVRGTLRVQSIPSQGTRIEAWVPSRPAA
jgi:signal transduction histidine kinase